MEEKAIFTTEEYEQTQQLMLKFLQNPNNSFLPEDESKLKRYIDKQWNDGTLQRDVFGLNPILYALQTADIAVEEIGLKRDAIIATILYNSVVHHSTSISIIEKDFGKGTAQIIHGLVRIQELYKKNPIIESENFRNLLISFAEDMRVILIMIADRVNLMRKIKEATNTEAKEQVSQEASYLYAPLAHKLGLYKLKSELEDLSLKYLEHDAYYHIKDKLNATKRSRDAYIESFISPIQKKLEDAGLHFHMKGRTKSIHSIWQKMKKQKCKFEGIYDLFAIRIIIDSPIDKEKMQCWQAYSIVTDMYMPNPKRLRDWLSVPKSNGYESLHITVLGPGNKWVEVQIRTERMDDIAERGLAAHWRYKGIKGESGIDEWLGNIRAALENNDDLQLMDQFKRDLYEDEVFVFTPKGELWKFPKGATILDFAYHIHSGVGNKCVGGKVNDKNVSIKTILQSGDQVEILTQNQQKPKRDWVNIVKTSRAKAKIKLALKEYEVKDGLYARELIERRLKNRKLELEDSVMAQLIKKLNFKSTTEFYKQVADEKLDINEVIEKYIQQRDYYLNLTPTAPTRSATEFNYENPEEALAASHDDVLVIDRNLKGVDFSLAQCCRPIYGDPVFGFVTVNGGIKVHRESCPNAPELRKRFGYRIVKARWSGKGSGQYSITIKVIGNDDLGIVNNITSIISKEEKIAMRSINIDSNDGLFNGTLVIQLDDVNKLEALLKKIRAVRGVKQVNRL
ncbi:MAG: RelA/SpoT family protein [Prevotella sp.]|nr:RelA/SpoT family protein [Prevotella sp.]